VEMGSDGFAAHGMEGIYSLTTAVASEGNDGIHWPALVIAVMLAALISMGARWEQEAIRFNMGGEFEGEDERRA